MEKKKVALSQEKAKEELYSLGDIVELD